MKFEICELCRENISNGLFIERSFDGVVLTISQCCDLCGEDYLDETIIPTAGFVKYGNFPFFFYKNIFIPEFEVKLYHAWLIFKYQTLGRVRKQKRVLFH